MSTPIGIFIRDRFTTLFGTKLLRIYLRGFGISLFNIAPKGFDKLILILNSFSISVFNIIPKAINSRFYYKVVLISVYLTYFQKECQSLNLMH